MDNSQIPPDSDYKQLLKVVERIDRAAARETAASSHDYLQTAILHQVLCEDVELCDSLLADGGHLTEHQIKMLDEKLGLKCEQIARFMYPRTSSGKPLGYF